MLIILSDLHFSDGTTSVNVVAEVFTKILFPQINSKLSADANKNINEIHLVLAGDTFDMVSTDKFLMIPYSKRPWNGNLDPDYAVNLDHEVVNGYVKVLEGIIIKPGCKAFIEECHNLKDINKLPFKITYIAGNHDRVITFYEELEQKVRRLFPGIHLDFTNKLRSEKYSTICRHGHEWDKICFGYEFARKVLHKDFESRFHSEYYKVQSIGEIVTAELMSGIIYRLNYEHHWKGVHDDLIDCIKYINNVRPAPYALDWLIWSLSDKFSQQLKDDISTAIYESLEAFLKTSLAKLWDRLNPDLIISGDIVDRLQLLKNFLKKDSFDSIIKALGLIRFIDKLPEFKDESFLEGALEDFKENPDIQFVVYGHTHYSKEAVITAEKGEPEKRYINTGAYLPLIQKARLNGYGIAKRMTITFIYDKSEDNRNNNKHKDTVSLEFWNGL
ncbi:MAG: hypothetical protein P9X26_00670, partial [Candidatus Stygibacter frigidus]|nr:hypothetical protein [Candidatus Stygibacter frigidus]